MGLEDVKREITETPGLKTSMAKWGVAGAVAGLIVPGLGSIVGAAAGAGWAYYKGTKKGPV